MNAFTVFVDSACDLPLDILEKWGFKCLDLSVKFNEGNEEFFDTAYDRKLLYEKLRNGDTATTSGVNYYRFENAFLTEIDKGNDILYIGFSLALSSTCSVGCAVIDDLREKFPERRIIAVDSLCASAGYGLLLELCYRKKAMGTDIEALAEFAENIKLKVNHWFTVGDIQYLKRGGRICTAAAVVATVLGIKPIMKMDTSGHLAYHSKVRGKRQSLDALAEKLKICNADTENFPVYICHSDCENDAEYLSAKIYELYSKKVDLTILIGPVIGSHVGPDTISVFFVGKDERQ